ncbi:MAG: alpha/beta hydrolase [Ramlibacter sp.]
MSQLGVVSPGIQGPALDTPCTPLRQLFQRGTAQRSVTGARLWQGDGQPVLVFPRQGTGPESTAPLREVLTQSGFRAFDWGHGVNRGPGQMGLNRWLRKLEECVIDVFETTQAPVTLLGWGLSGIYARELAKRANPLVRQVITVGTPFNTAADPQRQCKLVGMLDSGPERMPLVVRQRLRQRPPVPCTSLYSKDDGLVRWQQCVDHDSAECEHIEVPGATHDDLAMHPLALEIITHRLAQPEDEWRPYALQERATLHA